MTFGLLYEFIQSFFSNHFLSCIMTGADSMATKDAKNCMMIENIKKRKLREADPTPQKSVSR